MANISIVKGEIPILEEATSPKMFGHLGNALVKAEKVFAENKTEVDDFGIVVVTETIEDLICG
tara:strand:- start:1177 stop:1365 length:189 start_codon:yes stop_codon:yes gene_type:complete